MNFSYICKDEKHTRGNNARRKRRPLCSPGPHKRQVRLPYPLPRRIRDKSYSPFRRHTHHRNTPGGVLWHGSDSYHPFRAPRMEGAGRREPRHNRTILRENAGIPHDKAETVPQNRIIPQKYRSGSKVSSFRIGPSGAGNPCACKCNRLRRHPGLPASAELHGGKGILGAGRFRLRHQGVPFSQDSQGNGLVQDAPRRNHPAFGSRIARRHVRIGFLAFLQEAHKPFLYQLPQRAADLQGLPRT